MKAYIPKDSRDGNLDRAISGLGTRTAAAASGKIVFDGGRAIAHYDDLRLGSVFQGLFRARYLRPFAYEALLRARHANGEEVPVAYALGAPNTPEDIVYFDRLCRAVHTVNFMAQVQSDELLFLNVAGNHLLTVNEGAHGDVFGRFLNQCGLRPDRVALEIIESRIDDLDKLSAAVKAWQRRGYKIAIDDFGCKHSNFDRLWRLSPDFVKLDRSLILESETNCRARRILPKLVEIIHDLNAEVVCEGIETPSQDDLAVASGADFVQGFYYSKPLPVLAGQPAGDRLNADAA